MVAGDSVGAVSSHDIHHADLALLWLSYVEGVATQIANLSSDSRREVQSVNPLDGKDILIVGVWARRIGDFGQAVGDHPGFICSSDEDGVIDLVLGTISWASL